jgi:hypothetical protein
VADKIANQIDPHWMGNFHQRVGRNIDDNGFGRSGCGIKICQCISDKGLRLCCLDKLEHNGHGDNFHLLMIQDFKGQSGGKAIEREEFLIAL